MIYALTIMAIAATATAEEPKAAPMDEMNVAPVVAGTPSPMEDQLPQENIDAATKVGELSGVAEACGLEWLPHYTAYVESLEQTSLSETERMFLAAYHGAAQGNAYNMVEKTCSDEQKKDIQKAIDDNIAAFEKAEKK